MGIGGGARAISRASLSEEATTITNKEPLAALNGFLHLRQVRACIHALKQNAINRSAHIGNLIDKAYGPLVAKLSSVLLDAAAAFFDIRTPSFERNIDMGSADVVRSCGVVQHVRKRNSGSSIGTDDA